MGIVQGVARGFLNHLKITEFNETEKIDYDAGRTGGSGCGNGTRKRTGGHHGSHAVGDVIGLIGGVKVYQKFSSGDPDTSKTASSWFGACIFLIVAATILRSFFL